MYTARSLVMVREGVKDPFLNHIWGNNTRKMINKRWRVKKLEFPLIDFARSFANRTAERALRAIRINRIARGDLMISGFPFSFPPLLFSSLVLFPLPRGERALVLQVRTFEPIQERSRVLRPVNPLSVFPRFYHSTLGAQITERGGVKRGTCPCSCAVFLWRASARDFLRACTRQATFRIGAVWRVVYTIAPDHSQSCPT